MKTIVNTVQDSYSDQHNHEWFTTIIISLHHHQSAAHSRRHIGSYLCFCCLFSCSLAWRLLAETSHNVLGKKKHFTGASTHLMKIKADKLLRKCRAPAPLFLPLSHPTLLWPVGRLQGFWYLRGTDDICPILCSRLSARVLKNNPWLTAQSCLISLLLCISLKHV